MKQLTALTLKEWRESRIYLLIGLFIFIGLPIIAYLEAHGRSRPLQIEAAPWVTLFGGILTVFVAVGSTCRDLHGRLEDFWRSRPVSTTRWLTIKFCVGLLISLSACILPLIAQLSVNHRSEDQMQWMLFYFFFSLTAIFSIAFAAGCLLRRTAQAAMASLVAMLLIYLLPIILPPLSWMNADSITLNSYDSDVNWNVIGFMVGMLAIATAGLVLAYVALHRNWRIESGKRVLYAGVSLAIIIILTSVSFQVGTNLKVLEQAAVPNGEDVYGVIDLDGSLYIRFWSKKFTTAAVADLEPRYRKIVFTDYGIEFGEIQNPSNNDPITQVVAGRLGIAYQPRPSDHSFPDQSAGPWQMYPLPVARDPMKMHPTPLLVDEWKGNSSAEYSFPFLSGEKLYLFEVGQQQNFGLVCDRVTVLNIADPSHVKLLSNLPLNFAFDSYIYGDVTLNIPLPAIPDLSVQQRLEIALHFDRRHALEDKTLCFAEYHSDENTISEYRLFRTKDSSVTFLKVGEQKPSGIQKIFGAGSQGPLQMDHGLLYQLHTPGVVNASVDVFDTRGPHPMRQVGHFSAPGFWHLNLLPDGRLFAAGNMLYLVQPPTIKH